MSLNDERRLDLIASEQFDLEECRQYLQNIWPLYQENSVKKSVAALLGATGRRKNSFSYNQLLVLSFVMLLKTSADNYEEAWSILKTYLENKKD